MSGKVGSWRASEWEVDSVKLKKINIENLPQKPVKLEKIDEKDIKKALKKEAMAGYVKESQRERLWK